MRKEVTITIDGGRVLTVAKLPLGKYAELFLSLQELPKHLAGMDNFSNDEFFAKLPFIIGSSFKEVIKVISVATGVPEKDLEEDLGLDDLTELFIAFIEVNNIEKVVANVKKLMARGAAIKTVATPSPGSTGPSTPSPATTTGPSATS